MESGDFKDLELLYLGGTKLGQDQLGELANLLPRCEIVGNLGNAGVAEARRADVEQGAGDEDAA